MITTPRVSVLIVTYNREAYLPLAVRSVLAQTFRDFELLILDDASTDRSPEAIRDLLIDRRITYVQHVRNLGINANRNSGLALAKGEYVAMLDSDDVWLDPSKLERQVELLDQDRRCGLVGTHAKIIDEHGKVVGELKPETDPAAIRNRMLIRNQFIQSSVLIRRRVLDRAGWYDVSIPIWEDYELWLRLGEICTQGNIPLMLTGYRCHSGNISRASQRKSLASYWQIYRRYRNKYPHGSVLWLKACILTCLYHCRHPLAGLREAG